MIPTLPHRRHALLAGATLLAATACTTFGRPTPPPTPRYIDVPCTRPSDEVVSRTRDLLQQAGWTVTLVALQPPEVEASRAAVYLGAGENLLASGPYRFDLAYPTGRLRILVETVRVYPDGRAEHGRFHDDDSPAADKRQFESIISGLRSFCGAG